MQKRSIHALHARMPKNFVLEERLEAYRDYIETDPAHYASRWKEASAKFLSKPFSALKLDLGCGKGSYLANIALEEPESLWIGIDAEPVCIAYAAQKLCEAKAENAVLVPARADQLTKLFAPGEVDHIQLNFPTPYPRKKDAHMRLVILERLLEYRKLLGKSGTLNFKTDSAPLYSFALTQFALAGFEIVKQSKDLRAEFTDEPMSEYERRLAAEGAPVLGLVARVASLDELPQQNASLSLVDYLPQDFDEQSYVPLGMRATYENLSNLKKKLTQRGYSNPVQQ